MNRFRLAVVILLLSGLLLGCRGEKHESVKIEGIIVAFPEDSGDMPLSWHLYGEEPVVDPLPKSQIPTASEIIKTAIAKYPEGFLPKHLTEVYVYRDMIFRGNEGSSGVYAEPSSVFISYYDADPFWLEYILHSLVAQLLWQKYPGMVKAAGFDYEVNTPKDYSDEIALERNEDFLRRGYLLPLGSRSIEEDFCVFAGALMAGSRSAVQDAKDHKLVGEKMAKVKKFFALLDERFTEEFFKKQTEGDRGHLGY